MGAPAQRIFFVAHNRNHVRIFAGAAGLLRARGHDVRFAYIDDQQDLDATVKAAQTAGFPPTHASLLAKDARAGDIVCVGNDWGPKFFRGVLQRLKRNGAMRVGIVEGARFAKPGHYVNVERVLCWGPSGVDTMPGDKVVVGSPAVEAAWRPNPEPGTRPFVLINYKFTRGAAEIGPLWARMASAAAEAAGADYVISAHPLNVGELAGLKVSHEPFLKLLQKSTLMITRGSTAIYEGLAARVSVVYLPIKDEWRAEFADPMGAFEIAEDEAGLRAAVAAHAKSFAFDADKADVFLRRHVDLDANQPAPERMAAALELAVRERAALVGRAPESRFAWLAGGFRRVWGAT